MLDAGGNFVAEKFKIFCNSLNSRASIISSVVPQSKQWAGRGFHQIYQMHHEKCHESGNDVHIALLQIRTTPLGQGLLSPPTTLFNCLVRGIMPVMNRPP